MPQNNYLCRMIKNIILDLGMVTVGLNMARCIRAFEQLGVKDIGNYISNSRQFGLFRSIEMGEMSDDEFFDRFRQKSGTNAGNAEIAAAWNAFITTTPVELQQQIARLKRHYATLLLSNTNQMHYDHWATHCMGVPGGKTVEECFSAIYLSNHLHMAKPSDEIYKKVTEMSGVTPGETLYLDDNRENAQAGRRNGFVTLLCPTTAHTAAILAELEQTGDIKKSTEAYGNF